MERLGWGKRISVEQGPLQGLSNIYLWGIDQGLRWVGMNRWLGMGVLGIDQVGRWGGRWEVGEWVEVQRSKIGGHIVKGLNRSSEEGAEHMTMTWGEIKEIFKGDRQREDVWWINTCEKVKAGTYAEEDKSLQLPFCPGVVELLTSYIESYNHTTQKHSGQDNILCTSSIVDQLIL